jgi:hypothetical protein
MISLSAPSRYPRTSRLFWMGTLCRRIAYWGDGCRITRCGSERARHRMRFTTTMLRTMITDTKFSTTTRTSRTGNGWRLRKSTMANSLIRRIHISCGSRITRTTTKNISPSTGLVKCMRLASILLLTLTWYVLKCVVFRCWYVY